MIWWRIGQQVYDAYILWALGGFLALFNVIKPVTVCFLGLDRCFALIIPTGNRINPAKWIMIPTMIAVAIFFIADFLFFILPAFPLTSKTSCGAFLCLAPNSAGTVYTVLRYTSSLGILIVGIVFVISARKRFFDTTAVAKYTRLVFKMILLSFFFDFIPHTFSFTLYTLTVDGIGIATAKETNQENEGKEENDECFVVNHPFAYFLVRKPEFFYWNRHVNMKTETFQLLLSGIVIDPTIDLKSQ
uniref:Uncharacterized protein n=1 Tax=Panagrolaimus sp. JU765 TaxID=591449 RepID=A0AC34RKM1_9BILA